MAGCCEHCFGDRGLRRIITTLTDASGQCDYCRTKDVQLVTPNKLADYFEPLINVYEESGEGKTLVEWFKRDWRMFDHAAMDEAHAKELLAEVLDDGEVVRKRFRPRADFQTETLVRWETLRNELMQKNRYFPDGSIDPARFQVLLAYLVAEGVDPVWYRARIKTDEAAFTVDQMGAPPRRVASSGRANPPGIQYLYVGSSVRTAVAEVRPHTGQIACAVQFTLLPNLKLIDLRDPRRMVSPFLLEGDEQAIGLMRNDIEFLERLGNELTRPVFPEGAAIEYVPSQYLCEFIKKSGYDGVLYRSSVSDDDGINLALFDEGKATRGTQVTEHKVTRVTVTIA